MHNSFRHAIITATAIIGLSSFAAMAAAGDPTVSGSPAAVKAKPAMHHTQASMDERINDLHAKLMITPAQQPQWDAFAQVMRDNGRGMEQTFQQRVNTMSNMTAPENMQSYAQVAMNHAQDMQKLVPAFQALYDTMSDSQRKTADALFRSDAHHGKAMQHS